MIFAHANDAAVWAIVSVNPTTSHCSMKYLRK